MSPEDNSTYRKHFSIPVEQIPGATLTRKVRELWGSGDSMEAVNLLMETFLDLSQEEVGLIIDGQKRLSGVADVQLLEDDWVRPMGYQDFFIFMRRIKNRFSS